jgi:transcriptional regulator CtsR
MSWAVKNLIIDSSRIRSDGNIESEEYMSLLILEKKIEDLLDRKILSDNELKIIKKVSNKHTYGSIAKELDISRYTLRNRFNKVCQKLAYYLGDSYTNLGYANYLKRKFNLSKEEETKVIKFLLKEE